MAYHPEDNGVFCATCGREQDPGTRFCPNCGAVNAPAAGGGPMYGGAVANVPNYMAWAIIVTVFGGISLCCYLVGLLALAPGIVAIVYAAQVNGKLRAGDYAGAVSASNAAKTWCWVATAASVLVVIGAVLLFTLVGFAAILGGLS